MQFIARIAYRAAYMAARCWWFVRRPQTRGALIALWVEGRILLVRTSYRSLYTLPGGFVRRHEEARDAALRELVEELGIVLPPSVLTRVWHAAITFEYRQDTVTVWEATLDVEPSTRVNGCELVWAGWMAPVEALTLPLLPHVRAYLTERQRGHR